MVTLGLGCLTFGGVTASACSDQKASDGATPDAATTPPANASDVASDACTAGPPPSGIGQLVAGDSNGKHAVMILDDTGSPVVAYQKDDGSGGASSLTIEMMRWDRACSAWSPPIHVDTIGHQTENGRQIVVAFDASTGTVGIAYQAVIGQFGNGHHYELRYAALAKGASVVTPPERVDDPNAGDFQPASPGLGMADGKVYVAYQESFRLCNTSGCGAIVYRVRDKNRKWNGETELPGNGPDRSGEALENHTSLAIDADGRPAVAWLSSAAAAAGGVKMKAMFVRPSGDGDAGDAGETTPSTIFENADMTGTDAPWIELAFDGNKPRAVVILNRNKDYTTDQKTEWFVESDDGKTWKPPVALPHDHGASLDLFASIAIGTSGKIVIVSNSNASDGTDAFGSPKLLTSTDRTTFTVAGVAKDVNTTAANWVSTKVGADGKVQFVIQAPAGPDPKRVGVLYYREP